MYSNRLSAESSPYLLQHAHNPVDWYPWSDEAWEKARREDKLVLVSIGYSSCHWCHVMERESFEKEETAALMNAHYVCIKVDREERPDVDQVYMSAVQLMTGGGGWPLNCFCLPDGRPVYGGTYFPQSSWNDLMLRLHEFYTSNRQQAEEYAQELTKGLRQEGFQETASSNTPVTLPDVQQVVDNWKKYFDDVEGGPSRYPKFPLPNNYEFLLQYCSLVKDEATLKHVHLTLQKMAFGGIYDHVGGGFARYSTDAYWKVPHFEKMLYDNAQLVSLYSHGWQATKNPLYKDVTEETLEFIRREMTSPEGGFYAALDADSEGEEGKYYVWKQIAPFLSGLKSATGISEERKIACLEEYFSVNKDGYWEYGNHVLLRKKTDEQLAKDFSLPVQDLRSLVSEAKSRLLQERNKRIRPGLDNKLLTSWNGLMIKGYCDAFSAFGEREYLDAATRCANLFLEKAKSENNLVHLVESKRDRHIPGFLEDYALFIDALLALYACTFEENWLEEARKLADATIDEFYNDDSGFFFFTSRRDSPLVTRKTEIADNVIPSSNSCMARVLFYLARYFEDEQYEKISMGMLSQVKDAMAGYGSGYSNWGILALHHAASFHEIVVAGPDAQKKSSEILSHYLPNVLLAGSSASASSLPLLEGRIPSDRTLIYVCENKTCKLPVEEVDVALKSI